MQFSSPAVPPRLISLPLWCALITLLCLGMVAARAQDLTHANCQYEGKLINGAVPIEMVGKSGIVRCVHPDNQRRLRDYEFNEGRLQRQTDWDDLGQRSETHFHPNGAPKTRARQVVFDGKPAWDREEFWESGLLRLRGTYLEGGGAQGLVQSYDRAGPLAREQWYEQGRLTRRKGFDLSGQTILDEEFLADGQVKSLMQRYK